MNRRMARRREEAQRRDLERGTISLMARPRVEHFQPEGLDDIQRLLLVLSPEDRSRYRVLAIGRKQLPHGQKHDRFWGFVDLVLDARQDLRAALGAQTYVTKTRGLRHLPAAMPIAKGRYEISWHEGHAHLCYEIDSTSADYIITVANPDPAVWGLDEAPPLQYELFDETEVHVTVPTPFPPRLQERFRDRRYTPLDTIEYLDHPGAELIFVSH
jgi:hypothetical protein